MADGIDNMVDLATNLTIAWLGNPNVRANTEDATGFLQNIHATLSTLSGGEVPGKAGSSADVAAGGSATHEPAVSVRKSLGSKAHIISLIDGKPYVTLKRHLSSHGLTPVQYRERYGLKADYPMVAPAYAEKRRDIANKIGLGSKGRAARKRSAGSDLSASRPATPKRRGRPPKAAASK